MSTATVTRRAALRLCGVALVIAALMWLFTAQAVLSIGGQLERNEECRKDLTAYLREIDALHARTSCFPNDVEVSVPSTRMHLIGVWTMKSDAAEIRSRGATRDGDFMLTFKRPQSFESYE